jgi:hypothetical protein
MANYSDAVRHAWNNFFYQGFSADSLGLWRIYFGCGLFFYHFSQFGSLLTLNPTGASFYYLDPMWPFGPLGIQYNPPLLSFFVFAILLLATIGMIFGKWTRTSIVVIILCIFYLKGVRDSVAGDYHHRYVVLVNILFLFLLSKCGQVRSLDARTMRVKQRVLDWESSWPIKAMQIYVACFYLWAIIAKFRVSGWEWFAEGGRLQEVLLRRSARWGFDEQGEVVKNELSFQLAQMPDVVFIFALLLILLEVLFPLILFIKSARWKLVFVAVASSFHIANFVLLDVNFILFPFVLLVFFDLVPIHAWLKNRFSWLAPRWSRSSPDP